MKVEKSGIVFCLTVVIFYISLFTLFFSPVILSDRLLAPGDGLTYYLPNFHAGQTLWEPLLLSGIPIAADSQTMSWYPLSYLFSLFHSWNWFVVTAYVLSGCFTSGYVYSCTQSRIASLMGGITYSMSGFMMAHLGHTTIIHSAVWSPLLMWSLEKTRLRRDLRWAAVGIVAIGCGILAGHPQIFVYSLGVSLAYVFLLGWNAPIGRWRYYSSAFTIIVFGFCLAAVLLLPAMQLAGLSLRAQMSFDEFISYSLPLRQLPELLFPYLWGGSQESFYGVPYWGSVWGPTELTGYVGLLPLALAAICVWKNWRSPLVIFWLGVSVFSLLLTLGNNTPLVHLVYHLPAYNKFRVPARHFFEFTLALPVLAGYGVTTIERLGTSTRVVVTTLITSIVLMVITIAITPLLFSRFLIKAGINIEQFFLPTNPVIWVPFMVFFITSLALYYWSRQANSPPRKTLLLLALIIDLGSFGWFYEWRFAAPEKQQLAPPATAERYKDMLHLTSQRILPVRGGSASRMEIPVNLSRLWEIPSASGYGPLLLSRVSQLLSMATNGRLLDARFSGTSRSLDIMAVRYILLPRRNVQPSPVSNISTSRWAEEDMEIRLGIDCGSPLLKEKELHVPEPVPVTAIGIVSALACSGEINTGEEVVYIELKDEHGKEQTYRIVAGYDTAEWAYDCPDVLPVMKHSKATTFNSFSVQSNGEAKCEGHRYVTTLPLSEATRISEINLRWGNRPGAIIVSKISLFDDRSQQTYPVSLVASALSDEIRWRHVEDIEETSIYENLRAMPRAWLVTEVVTTTSDQVLQAIQTSLLPDGREFDPSHIALVEEPIQFLIPQADQKATAQVVHLSNTSVEIHTSSKTPAFLVLSDVYYPGWQATIDDALTHILQTDYVLRGVMVPAGGHVVKFDFRPTTFYVGATISSLSLLMVGVLFYWGSKSDS